MPSTFLVARIIWIHGVFLKFARVYLGILCLWQRITWFPILTHLLHQKRIKYFKSDRTCLKGELNQCVGIARRRHRFVFSPG
ncbi:hypothetical protein [Nostoc sp.]|uniref:hypothetical protein n=1 Tax=Nostoc sp. TaxID=1180 RepID=UPI002FF70C35